MTKRRMLRLAGVLLSIAIVIGAGLLGLSWYRCRRAEAETMRVAVWIKAEILERNPVRYESATGLPDWLGETALSVLMRTTTGQPISVNVFIESNLFHTRTKQIELYAAGLRSDQFDRLSNRERADQLFHRQGRTISLPLEALNSRRPIDLKTLLPEAFADDETTPPHRQLSSP